MTDDAKPKKWEAKCTNCGKWFTAKMDIGSKAFDGISMSGNTTDCPHCGKRTAYNPNNMRVTFEDGSGFSGNDT